MNEPQTIGFLSRLGMEVIAANNKGNLLIECPFAEWTHGSGRDRNPDFWVYPDATKGTGFQCFACKEKGSLVALIRRLAYRREEDYSIMANEAAIAESMLAVDEPYEREIEEDYAPVPINDLFADHYPKAWEVEEARLYLQIRHISENTAKLLELRYDPEQFRILFPIKDHENKLYGFTGRTILEDFEYPNERYPKVKDYSGVRKSAHLLGEHLWQEGKPPLVVEGLFALAHVIEIGAREYCNPVASMGSSLSKAQQDILVYYNLPVYPLYDGDMPGCIGLFGTYNHVTEKFEGGGLIDRLKGKLPIVLPMFPPGIEDPDLLTDAQLKEMFFKNFELY